MLHDEGECDGLQRTKIEGLDIDIADDSGNDGGWNPKLKRPKYLHCDFDVRDASQMTQSDVMLGYMHGGHPVVLRNSFYETDGADRKWTKKGFEAAFGATLMIKEATPLGDRFGLGEPNVTSVTDYLKTLEEDDAMMADVWVEGEKHPMNELANEWAPPSYTNRKKNDEISLFDAEQANALVLLTKKGSRSHHRVFAHQTYVAVVFGRQEWSLLPPRLARTVRGGLSDVAKVNALRCDLVTGDVLLIPEMWSGSFTAKANGVSMQRIVYRRVKS